MQESGNRTDGAVQGNPTSSHYQEGIILDLDDDTEYLADYGGQGKDPVGFYDDSPERRLMKAMLIRAILDLVEPWAANKNFTQGTVMEWIRSAAQWMDSKDMQPYSYLWICLHLGLDADFIRNHCKLNRKKIPEPQTKRVTIRAKCHTARRWHKHGHKRAKRQAKQ